MSANEKRKLDGELVKLDIRIRKLIIKILKRVLLLKVNKPTREFLIIMASIIIGCPTFVVILQILAKK